MANILARYGIKEVADMTFYDIDETGKPAAPVLFLDTLKVSTIEQTGEQTQSTGGKGNPPIIIWDYGKEINVTLEDALFSIKSMAIMFGNGTVKSATSVMKTIQFTGATKPTTWTTPNGKEQTIPTEAKVYDAEGKLSTTQEAGKSYFITFDVQIEGQEVVISANSFPGTYYVTGDTFARSEITGKDEFFQFVIPKAKVQSENTITLEAEGDPSVFNMSLRVLRPTDGQMMKLIQYQINETTVVNG